MKIAIIGGGAAGFFAAINIKELAPSADVTIYEGSNRPLAKVSVSGGGRCNLTNSFDGGESFIKLYPRGEKVVRNCFKKFNHQDAYRWFEEHGIKLTTQSDNCVFPQSQRSSEIIDTFYRQCDILNIEVKNNHLVSDIRKEDDKFVLTINNRSIECDVVLATTGGSPMLSGLSLYEGLPLKFIDPIPSLFSFKIPNDDITDLTGAVIEDAKVTLKGGKLCGKGALLITHWGISGPAVLKLSSYAAIRLNECDYRADVLISWAGDIKQEDVLKELKKILAANSKKLVSSLHPFGLSTRVWEHIMQKADISLERRAIELGSKGINRLVAVLSGDEYAICGRGANKDEFVTCGGIATSNVNPTTMEAYDCENLLFAGEVLDIDAITGGFNLQAAWSTAYVAALTIAAKIENN